MNRLYVDIETVPAQRPDVLEAIRDEKRIALDAALSAIRPPSNYGPEAAAKWQAEKGDAQAVALRNAFDAEVDEAYRKTGLDGAFGQVCVIGIALNDGPVMRIFREDWADERSVLQDFGCQLTDLIEPSDVARTVVVGHNVASFDLRFLAQRSIVRRVQPHSVIVRAAATKPWETDKVFDTMVQWAGVGRFISLDKLCNALGVTSPKSEIDGSKVWDYVKAGRVAEVADYCAGDVETTRRIHRRMTFMDRVVHLQPA